MTLFTTFEIVGIVVSAILATILFCILTYACGLLWILLLPCRGLVYCCKSMNYDDEDEGTCLGCFGNNYVV